MTAQLDAGTYVAHLREVGTLDDSPWPQDLVVALGSASTRRLGLGRNTPFGALSVRDGIGVLSSSVVGASAMAVVTDVLSVLGVKRLLLVGRGGALSASPSGTRSGELVVARGAYCDNGASRAYGASGMVSCDPALTVSLPDVTRVVTTTVDSPLLVDERRVDELLRRGVELIEMELAAAVVVARRSGVSVGGLFVVSDVRTPGRWMPGDPRLVEQRLTVAVELARAALRAQGHS